MQVTHVHACSTPHGRSTERLVKDMHDAWRACCRPLTMRPIPNDYCFITSYHVGATRPCMMVGRCSCHLMTRRGREAVMTAAPASKLKGSERSCSLSAPLCMSYAQPVHLSDAHACMHTSPPSLHHPSSFGDCEGHQCDSCSPPRPNRQSRPSQLYLCLKKGQSTYAVRP